MFKLKEQPYHILLFIAIAFFILSLFVNSALDIHVHDTYYVITHQFSFISYFVLFIWILYVMTHSILYSKKLTGIHIITTVLCSVGLTIIPYFNSEGFAGMPRRYFDYSNFNSFHKDQLTLQQLMLGIFLLLLLGLILYFINLAIGVYKRVSN